MSTYTILHRSGISNTFPSIKKAIDRVKSIVPVNNDEFASIWKEHDDPHIADKVCQLTVKDGKWRMY